MPPKKNTAKSKSVFVSDSDQESDKEKSKGDETSEEEDGSETEDETSGSSCSSNSGSSSESSESSDDSSEDEDEEEEKEPKRKRQRQDAGSTSEKQEDKSSFKTNNALLRNISQIRAPNWVLHACALARQPVMYHDLSEDTRVRFGDQGMKEYVSKCWSWLREIGVHLPEAIKSEMLLTTLTNFGSLPALNMLAVLGFPAYFNGQFFIRYFWGGLYSEVSTRVLQQFIREVAKDPNARRAYGTRHVYLRLMSQVTASEETHVDEIVAHDSSILLRRLKSVEDVNDLLSLGWRPNVGTLLHHAQTHSLHRIIKDLAPAICTDLSTTIPMWLDSPFDPASITPGPASLDSHEFWNGVPEYWLASADQIQRACPTLANPRGTKMPALEPGDLQRILSLMHKAPTLIRLAWAKKSLTWLNYILLFRYEHFYTLLQILLVPPITSRPPCLCQIYRLTHINNARKSRRKKQRRAVPTNLIDPADADIGPRSHQGCENEYPSVILRPQQCMPWYRAAPSTNSDWDRYDVIHAALSDRKILHSPYGLSHRGRTVAIAHLLILFNAKGITATSIQLLADIVAAWPSQPSIKDLRPLLAKMHALTQILKVQPLANTSPAPEKKISASADEGGAVLGSFGSTGAVQSHVLYRKPKDAVLCSALRKLHQELTGETYKWPYAQPIKLANPNTQLLREIYDTVDRLIFPPL